MLKDWQLGVVLQYQSGAVIQVPNSNNQLFTQLNRGGGLFSGASTYYNFANGKTPDDVFLQDATESGIAGIRLAGWGSIRTHGRTHQGGSSRPPPRTTTITGGRGNLRRT